MTPALRENLLKGAFLGIWAYLALVLPSANDFLGVVAVTAVGTLLGLALGGVWQTAKGHRPGRNPLGFLLLTLLDSAYFVYPGLVGGAALGAFLKTDPPADLPRLLVGCLAGGAVVGLVIEQLRRVPSWLNRFLLSLVFGVALTAFVLHYLPRWPLFDVAEAERLFAQYILLGLPFFAILMLAGETEESEPEVAAWCAALGLGLYFLRLDSSLPQQFEKVIFLAPLGLYFILVTRFLPRAQVFKQSLRGFANLSVGRGELALNALARALELNPKSDLAARGLTRLLRTVDPGEFSPEARKRLPAEFCLDLAEESLLGQAPTAKQTEDALKLIAATEAQAGSGVARASYLKAVALTHQRRYDEAAAELARLLDPEGPLADSPSRGRMLVPAWALAAVQHPVLTEKLGETELAKPGRRVEALIATERQLTRLPEDATGIALKRLLYAGLTESELTSAGVPPELNYDYLDQLGQSLVETDPERATGYLGMAARGLPARSIALFEQLATLAESRGDAEARIGYLGQVKRVGLTQTPKALAAADRARYLAALEALSLDAERSGEMRTAVENYRLLIEAGDVTPERLRKLAELYALADDPLNAAVVAERGLLYDKADADFLAKKASYYYSIPVTRIESVRQQVLPWFDWKHCIDTATRIADQPEVDAETLDYGTHLAQLARALKPDSLVARLAEARLTLRRGESTQGLAQLEDIRASERGSGDDEEAWFAATRLLGSIYLDEVNRPDLAADCFNDYRASPRSGAETLFQLGRALEQIDDIPGAIRAFEAITKAYSGHARSYEARESAQRLRQRLSQV